MKKGVSWLLKVHERGERKGTERERYIYIYEEGRLDLKLVLLFIYRNQFSWRGGEDRGREIDVRDCVSRTVKKGHY